MDKKSGFVSILIIAALILPVSDAMAAPKRPLIKVFLSTCEEYTGELIGSSDACLRIKTKDGTRKAFWLNILQLDLVDKEGNILKEGNTVIDKGKAFLDAGLRDEAAAFLVPAYKKDNSLGDSIKKVYAEAKVKLPKGLGGKSNNGRYLLSMKRSSVTPTVEQVKYAMKCSREWGDIASKVTSKAHLIETDHFLIYSTWKKAADKKLIKTYEKLYKMLTKAYGLYSKENIWLGKLPVYAFWGQRDFVKFATGAAGLPPEVAMNAGGFAGRRGTEEKEFRYVVLGPVQRPGMSRKDATIWFYELLVHEAPHAFNGRYINNNRLPNWIDEGMAEHAAAVMFPASDAARGYKMVGKYKEFASFHVDAIFDVDNIPMNRFYYGISQSIVRFLRTSKKASFKDFLIELKSGKSEDEALQKIYGLSRDDLVEKWRKFALRAK